jgi:fatty acid desaturase
VLLWTLLGPAAAWKLHLLPVFVVFPVLFTVNRLGQHYDVDPADPARWGTLLRRSPWFWDRVYLWSNYHLEHHYFPKVPFYRLPRLRRALDPFFRRRGVPARTYGGLLYDWFVKNRVPHTRWDAEP